MNLRSLIATHAPASVFGPVASLDPWVMMTRDLDRLMHDALGTRRTATRFETGLSLDIAEDESAVTVTAECPGVLEKDIDITLSDGVLTIKGEKKSERDEKKETLHLRERVFGSFSRSIAIGSEIDAEKITAHFAQGVLTVTLPKMERAAEKTKKITIQTT